MKRFLLVMMIAFFLPGRTMARPFGFSAFGTLPVQHDGRLEPLDSFARAFLTQFSGRDTIDSLTARAWLAEMLFAPSIAYDRPVFDVPNPSVQNALGLARRPSHRYSFAEISAGFAAHRDMLDALLPRQGAPGLDPAQVQLLALYTNTLWYFEISRSLSLVQPQFAASDAKVAAAIGVPPGQALDYLEFLPHRAAYLAYALPLFGKERALPDDVLQIGALLQRLEIDKQSKVLRVIPPQWQQGSGGAWLSPWAVLQAGGGSPATVRLLDLWRQAGRAYEGGDDGRWNITIAALHEQAVPSAVGGAWRLTLESLYNAAALFPLSLDIYIFAFLLLLGAWSGFGKTRIWQRAALIALSSGALLHFGGLALRITIMARPPVGTLYESVLFVGFIAVAASLALEIRTKAGIGLLIGALSGAVLQFIGLRYAADGDTMAPLVAVLNTNFWLATHVVCVTIGYGASLVTGLLGHLWLLQNLLRREDGERLAVTSRAMVGGTLIALLFATTGTILGGIWADQSWGRFWGWDPKENGALLIVLWLLFLLHGKLSGLLPPLPLAMGTAATTIVVALSWFGVNLLGVGLHSYGFTAGIAYNLFAFCAVEIVLIAGCGIAIRRRGATV